MRILVLPGLDGTGRLLARFAERLRETTEAEVEIVRFSPTRQRSYEELLAELPLDGGPVGLVAESFSGPLAIMAAARHPQVRALALVATFARCPVGPVLRRFGMVAPPIAFHPPPDPLIRAVLAGDDASDEFMVEVRKTVNSVSLRVVADRVRQVCRVDVEAELAGLTMPLLYIAGSRDRLVRPGVVRRLLEVQQRLEVRVLDAPHFVMQRKPVETAGVVAEFFGRAAAMMNPSLGRDSVSR